MTERVGAVWWGRKTESSRAFLFGSLRGGLVDPPLRASNEGLPRPRVARAQGITSLPRLFLLRLQQLVPLLEDPVDRLRGAGIEAETAAFQASGRIELIRRRREPGAGRANGNTNAVVSAAVRMADEVIANDHHRFDSFEETLREDLKHVFLGKTAHFHSFTSAFNRSFSSGIWVRLFSRAPMIFSRRAGFRASLSCCTRRS